MNEITRRDAFRYLIAGALAVFSTGYPELGFSQEQGNFRHIYLNKHLRGQFFLFLKNVFNLYPEEDFDSLISEKVMQLESDRDIYEAILTDIPSIRPFLSDIRYALPSLRKQKEVMCQQTLELLDNRRKFNGYLEVGTTGRYFDHLRDNVEVKGKRVFVNSAAPTYGAADIMERGQIRKMGTFIPLNEYQPIPKDAVEDESLDLVTVYIGFHHAPENRRYAFIQSCYRVLRKDGILIVRDHDVISKDLVHFVALAHDVFNAGLELPWHTNEVETRNFLSLNELQTILRDIGFREDERRLLQAGDPTRNTLMKFVKV